MVSRPDGNTPSSAGRPYCHALAGTSCYFLPKLCWNVAGSSNAYRPPIGARISLLPPGGEDVAEGANARLPLLYRQNGAFAAAVVNGNIEPAFILEQLQIALPLGVDGSETYHEKSGGHFGGKPRERLAARLLGFLCQDSGDVGDAAATKVWRQGELDLDHMARRECLIAIAA